MHDERREGPSPSGVEAARQAEADDLQAAVEARHAAAQRHGLWAVLGISPAMVIPLVLSVGEFGLLAVGAVSIGVSALETWRALRARREAAELGLRLATLTGAPEGRYIDRPGKRRPGYRPTLRFWRCR